MDSGVQVNAPKPKVKKMKDGVAQTTDLEKVKKNVKDVNLEIINAQVRQMVEAEHNFEKVTLTIDEFLKEQRKYKPYLGKSVDIEL